MIAENTLHLAKKLWDYHHMNHPIKKSDCILVLGSHDLRVADRAVELYQQNMATWVVFSGGLGRLTRQLWTEPEADLLASIALKKGIPKEFIIIENKSTNTGENILFTREVLKEKNIDPKNFIVIQKPYMERRSYATFKRFWPEKELIVTSPQIDFEKYPTSDITMDQVIDIMVGDLQRIMIYPQKGFQIFQQVPEQILDAYNQLIVLGYTKSLVNTPY
ncbi:MAG: YdcF family protein [Flavisolibacter sp.]